MQVQDRIKNAPYRFASLWLAGAVLVLIGLPGTAWSRPLVLLSENSVIYQQVGNEIKRTYQQPLDLYSAENLPAQSQLNARLSIAIGAKACEQLLQRKDQFNSLTCTFIPRATFLSLLELYGNTDLVQQHRLGAIYLDQPLDRQMRLARLLMPDAKSIGTMFGPYSIAERETYEHRAKVEQFSPLSITLDAADNPIEQLQPLVRQSDVFLALPDRALFNRATAKWLLYITLNQHVPVIGFSKTYVEAGALAAVFPTPAQIGRQAGELLLQLERGQPLPPPEFPRYFTVASNPVVARSLQLPIPSDASLQKLLEDRAR
jgi:putative tryptophan/tyrosine transport system substrate-binding protein